MGGVSEFLGARDGAGRSAWASLPRLRIILLYVYISDPGGVTLQVAEILRNADLT